MSQARDPLRGLNVEQVRQWLREHCDALGADCQFELIAAGGSNLSYTVTDGEGRRAVLRRPPSRQGVATAHDMQREYRVMSALQSSEVPVPDMLAYCQDVEVTGSEFYLMSFVDGIILRDKRSAAKLDDKACQRATDALIDTQLAFHQLDLEAFELDDLGQHDAYVQRQIRRWSRQVSAKPVRELPLLHELKAALEASVPGHSYRPGLVHGDYRFDNTVLSDSGEMLAVLDWELCTIGDPQADFCWSVLYWSDPEDDWRFLPSAPTLDPRFVRRQWVIDCYRERSGLALDHWRWYEAFSFWKMACIIEGVYTRLLAGAGGGMAGASAEKAGAMVEGFLHLARSRLDAS